MTVLINGGSAVGKTSLAHALNQIGVNTVDLTRYAFANRKSTQRRLGGCIYVEVLPREAAARVAVTGGRILVAGKNGDPDTWRLIAGTIKIHMAKAAAEAQEHAEKFAVPLSGSTS